MPSPQIRRAVDADVPELARLAAERALVNRASLLGNRLLLAHQSTPLDPINL